MKKLLALALILCLFCVSAASADTKETSDGTPLPLDGFTLTPDSGMMYELHEKIAEEIYITVYPFAASGDTSTNLNLVWNGGTFTPTASEVDASLESVKDNIVSGLEEYGYTVNSWTYSGAVESAVFGESCISVDTLLDMSYQTVNIVVCQRQLYVGSKGYVITISAADTDTLDRVTETLSAMIAWN